MISLYISNKEFIKSFSFLEMEPSLKICKLIVFALRHSTLKHRFKNALCIKIQNFLRVIINVQAIQEDNQCLTSCYLGKSQWKCNLVFDS